MAKPYEMDCARSSGRSPPFRIAAVGHRIVHGGTKFVGPAIIDDAVVAELAALQPLAPLHQSLGLAVVDAARLQRPDVPHVAAFDTAFHASMPVVAQRFALPQSWFDRGVRRFGFHGLSYEFIASKLAQMSETEPTRRVVVAHLGSGASLCALHDGRSVATTMSFTPTDGLMMATRSGALDPAVVLYLLREQRMSVDAVEHLLNLESGLLGVSGSSGDMRTLLASSDPAAQLAVQLFVYRVVIETGAMVAALGGWMRWCSPAASARTRRRSERESARRSRGLESTAIRRATKAGRCGSIANEAASACGTSRQTRKP